MQILRTELFRYTQPNTLFLVSANGKLRKDMSLVMGRGAALQLTKKIPGFDKRVGLLLVEMDEVLINRIDQQKLNAVKQLGFDPDWYNVQQPVQMIVDYFRYFVLIAQRPLENRAGVGLFQVKKRWDEAALLDLIEKSAVHLSQYMTQNPHVNVRMNLPGVGNGRLKRDEVIPVLEKKLSQFDKLTICYR
ncbi:MAG: hypothetical protein KQI81_08865 [Deltaproteobacteria bacterium]|nr:hypothetical protein [Deltaproteobacteria bacterium]